MTSRYSCRVCLKPTLLKKLKAIFGDAGEIANKIYITTGVQIIDMLNYTETAMICEQCKDSLDVAINFRNLCRKSDLIFREITCEHEEKNWNKNLLSLQYSILNEKTTENILEIDVKCEAIENPAEMIEKNHESEYEYIAYEVNDTEYIDENVEYLISEINNIEDLKLNQRYQNKARIQLNSGGTIYECEICGRNDFSSKTKYSCHLYRHRVYDANRIIEKQCIRCGENFGNYIKWEQHMELEHPMIYTCDYCGGISRSRAAFTQHVLREAKNAKPYLCSDCGLGCKSLYLFQLHKKACKTLNPTSNKQIEAPKPAEENITKTTAPAYNRKYAEYLEGNINDRRRRNKTVIPPNHDGTFYTCQKCGKNDIPTKSSYSSHMYRHLIQEARKNLVKQCIKCGEKFGTFMNWEAHMEKFHPTAYKCDYCGNVFRNRANFTSHILQEKKKYVPYVCSACGLRCKTRNLFKNHKQCCKRVDNFWLKHHEKSKAIEKEKDYNFLFLCKICGSVHMTESALRKHMKRHKAAGEKFKKQIDLTCSYCKHVSRTENSARMHIYTHRKKNLPHNIFCLHYPYCKTTFFSPRALDRHLSQHHRKGGPKSLYCDHCNKSFTQKFNLKKHLLKKHFKSKNIVRINPNDENHPCAYCGKIFTLKGLITHEQQHIRLEKIYTCDFCGREFNLKGPLQTHMKFVHKQVKKYFCEQCPEKSWSNKVQRDSHLRRFHSAIIKSERHKEMINELKEKILRIPNKY